MLFLRAKLGGTGVPLIFSSEARVLARSAMSLLHDRREWIFRFMDEAHKDDERREEGYDERSECSK